MVVVAQERLALQPGQHLGEALVLRPGEGDTIALGLPVGRIDVKQGVGTVVALQAIGPVQVLDLSAGEPEVGLAQVLLQSQQIDSRRGRGAGAEALAGDPAAKGQLLEVEESRGALDVGAPI